MGQIDPYFRSVTNDNDHGLLTTASPFNYSKVDHFVRTYKFYNYNGFTYNGFNYWPGGRKREV
jgi:hypothetical protein